jgi:agmatine deiminase
MSSDDAWMRDIGPTFVLASSPGGESAGARRGVDWRFNAWGGLEGGLYFPWDRDERVAEKVLEGGSIHVDGEGTVMATEECLLNDNRNRGLSRAQIERTLFEYLGAEKMIWLGEGVYGDETDGHVDDLACFARPGEVLRLPSPGPMTITAREAAGVDAVPGSQPRRAGDRLAASYVNFYPASERVVFPLLDERFDERAAAILRECFPDREFVGVDAREILLGGGSIHCITQQVPAV